VAGPVLQVAEGGRMGLGYPRLLHSLQMGETFITWGDPKQIQTARLKK
jgi:hypothetical protein